MPEKDRLDLLIDSAIATYAEPSAGLEDRVLRACAALPSESSAKPLVFPVRRVLLPWIVALGAAACALLPLWVHRPQASHPKQEHASSPLHTLPAPVSPVIATQQLHPMRPAVSRVHLRQMLAVPQTTPAPKLDVFPTPEPLTPQEQALVAFIARASRPRLDALIAAQQQSTEPISIPEIQIQPIAPPEQGNK